MAFLAEDDKLQDSQGSADQGQGSAQSSEPAPLINSGGSLAGSQVSTAGVGKGGRGNFTNIQAYLEANKGNNTTGDALSRDVGSEFDTEQSKIQSDSEAKKSEGAAKAAEARTVRQKAGFATTNDVTPDQENEIKQGLAGQYSAPKVAYTIGQNASQYGQQLQNDQGFDALLNQTYNKAAGGQISAGQKALQRQLDSRNDGLAGQRQDLASRYKALESLAGTATKDTNDALSGYEKQYQDDITGAKSALGTTRTQLEDSLKNFTNPKEEAYTQTRNRYEAISRLLGLDPTPTEYQGPGGGDFMPVANPDDRFADFNPNTWDSISNPGTPFVDPGVDKRYRPQPK